MERMSSSGGPKTAEKNGIRGISIWSKELTQELVRGARGPEGP